MLGKSVVMSQDMRCHGKNIALQRMALITESHLSSQTHRQRVPSVCHYLLRKISASIEDVLTKLLFAKRGWHFPAVCATKSSFIVYVSGT